MSSSEAVAPPRPVLAKAPAAARAGTTPVVAALVVLTVVGAALRVYVAHQSVFADELSTYWISATHGLGDVLSLLYSTGRIHHAEITPPLSFLTSWLSTRLGTTPELLRLPALLAGTATIPLVYVLGMRTVGRRAGLLAAAVTTLSPFMIYYSAEARAYGLTMFFVLAAVLSMLLALDTRRRRYWILYAVFSAAAFYAHYTCVFVLAVAFVWVVWAEPSARRPALLANVGAAALVIPWLPGLIADLQSPTVKILSALSLFTPHQVRIDIEHWAIGYPYAQAQATGLGKLPGVLALVLLGLATIISVCGVGTRVLRGDWSGSIRRLARHRVALVFLLMLATPVGEILVSALGNHIIGVRDLAASWPFLALFCSAFVIAAGPRLGLVAAGLGVVAFALSASKMFEVGFQRPNYQGAASYVANHARPADVVIDETGELSPGPLTGFDAAFRGRQIVVRAKSPAERDHPYTVFDPVVPVPSAVSRAIREAHGGDLFVVGSKLPGTQLPDGYRLTTVRVYPGLERTLAAVYSRSPASQR